MFIYVILTIFVLSILVGFVSLVPIYSKFLVRSNEATLKTDLLKAKIEGQIIKNQVDIVRRERLLRDLVVVENRGILVGNQAVVADLRIEEKRRELGMDKMDSNDEWQPIDY